MKITSKKTYQVVLAMLEYKKFTQYQISKDKDITFSLVNKVVNWFVQRGYVARQNGQYVLISPPSIFGIFPIYRKMKPYASFDVSLSRAKILSMIKGRGALCLTTALIYYDDYYRDPVIHAYLDDKKIIDELKSMRKGYSRIELYKEDLNKDDFVKMGSHKVTRKIRTVVDLFCSNRSYAAERLIKKEWA